MFKQLKLLKTNFISPYYSHSRLYLANKTHIKFLTSPNKFNFSINIKNENSINSNSDSEIPNSDLNKTTEYIEDLLDKDLIKLIKLNKQNEYFRNFPLNKFNDNDKSILKSFQNKKPTILLTNNNTKSRYLLALGILNKITQNKQSFENPENNFSENISKEEKGLFLSPTTILKNKKLNTKQKKFGKPRGALIISEKPEISMIYYRIFRLLDPTKKIRLARIGSSMMAMSPIAEYQDQNDLSESEEEVDKEEIIKANLILNSEWDDLDVMFATTKMTKFILLRKELFDPFDINPEIIIIDDFDYIIEKDKHNLDVILQKFISVNSSFYNPEYPRKLILRSSTILIKEYIREIDSREENEIFQEAVNEYIEMLDSFLLKKGEKTNTEKAENKNPANINIDNLDESKILIKKFPKSEKSDENSEMKSIKFMKQKIKTPKKFDLHFNDSKPNASQATNKPNPQEEINIVNYNVSESSEPAPKFIKERKLAKKIFGDSNNNNNNQENLSNQQAELNSKPNEAFKEKIAENAAVVCVSTSDSFREEKINEEDFADDNLNNYEIFKSEKFMDLKNICRKINVFFEILEDNKIDKKVKKLLSLIYPKDENKNFVVCCKQKNLNLLKETLKKRNIDYLLFNSDINIIEKIQIQQILENHTNKIILLDVECLKSFTYTNIKNFILYDVSKDIRDYIRLFNFLEEDDNVYYITNVNEFSINQAFYDQIATNSKNGGVKNLPATQK